MKTLAQKKYLISNSYAAVPFLFILLSCGSHESSVATPTQAKSGCETGSALIGVYDASLTILCGCDESAGTTAIKPASLTCTVPSGTQVTFSFQDKTRKHQILSSGPKSFASSAVFDPNADAPIGAHGFRTTETGIFAFVDAFDSTLSGQIISR
jgi:hypothetical protein